MPETIITVQGSARGEYAPERAVLTFTLAGDGPEREPVVADVAAALERVSAVLRDHHDPQTGPVAAWSTDRVSVAGQRPWSSTGEQLPLVHRASVGGRATVSGLDALPALVDALAAEPLATIDGIEWMLGEGRRTAVLTEVRSRAVKDAVTKATVFAAEHRARERHRPRPRRPRHARRPGSGRGPHPAPLAHRDDGRRPPLPRHLAAPRADRHRGGRRRALRRAMSERRQPLRRPRPTPEQHGAVERVTRLLARADLSGLAPGVDGMPTDEYAPEAEDLVQRARRAPLTADDVRQVWRHWFDDALEGHPESELAQLAARITVTVGLDAPMRRPQQ